MHDEDRKLMARKGAAMAFCPSSNLFLGSGLFDLQAARRCNVRVGAGSDVGGGTSLSMLRTLGDAYKVLQLRGQSLTPFYAFYVATLGSARALHVDDRIGNFGTAKEADFAVLDASRTTITELRWAHTQDGGAKLFALILLGDDRIIADTHLMGQRTELGGIIR
jgi:guanine deaminase